MSEERLQDLIQYRLERANETFEEALLMQEGDYVDFVVFKRDDVEPWIPQVKNFIEAISQFALEK